MHFRFFLAAAALPCLRFLAFLHFFFGPAVPMPLLPWVPVQPWIVAFVVPDETAAPEHLVAELTALASERLAAHQRPRRITVVDALPRTATGKLQRFALKSRVESR